MITTKSYEYNHHLYICFIDYTEAFDTKIHKMIWENKSLLGFHKHIIELIKGLYKDQEAAVRTNVGLTEWFPIEQGVRQGCIMSPPLFNITHE